MKSYFKGAQSIRNRQNLLHFIGTEYLIDHIFMKKEIYPGDRSALDWRQKKRGKGSGGYQSQHIGQPQISRMQRASQQQEIRKQQSQHIGQPQISRMQRASQQQNLQHQFSQQQMMTRQIMPQYNSNSYCTANCGICGHQLKIDSKQKVTTYGDCRLDLTSNGSDRFKVYFVPNSNLNGFIRGYQILCSRCHDKGKYRYLFSKSNGAVIQELKSDYMRTQAMYLALKAKYEQVRIQNQILQREIRLGGGDGEYRRGWRNISSDIVESDDQPVDKLRDKIEAINETLSKIKNLPQKIEDFFLASQGFLNYKETSQIYVQEKQEDEHETLTQKEFSNPFSFQVEDIKVVDDMNCTVSKIDDCEEEEERENGLPEASFLEGMKQALNNYEKNLRSEYDAIVADFKSLLSKGQQLKETHLPSSEFGKEIELVLNCSGCGRDLFLKKTDFKKISPSHFQMGVNIYIFNSPFKNCLGKQFDQSETFEVVCSDCKEKNIYRSKLLERCLDERGETLQLKNKEDQKEEEKKTN